MSSGSVFEEMRYSRKCLPRRPVVDGNISPESSASRRTSVSTSIAREASGTRVLTLGLHAIRRHGPGAPLKIDLRPMRKPRLAGRLAVRVTNANNSFAAGLALSSNIKSAQRVRAQIDLVALRYGPLQMHYLPGLHDPLPFAAGIATKL